MLEAADGELCPILMTALYTGLRRSELFRLTWRDIDFMLGVIRMLQTKHGERREIPLANTLRRLPRRLDSAHVFPGKTG